LEAITRKKEVDEMKTMTKEFGALSVTKAGPVYTINADVFGWEQITPGAQFF
jgi:hypothetical protein